MAAARTLNHFNLDVIKGVVVWSVGRGGQGPGPAGRVLTERCGGECLISRRGHSYAAGIAPGLGPETWGQGGYCYCRPSPKSGKYRDAFLLYRNYDTGLAFGKTRTTKAPEK